MRARHGWLRRHVDGNGILVSAARCVTHTPTTRAPPQRRVQRWHVVTRDGAAATRTVAAHGVDNDDDAATLPAALRRARAALNTRRKTWLMAALGSDFVRAGLCHHGVQTSYSAVQSQSLQQLTGLPHIPAKLLLSCLTAGSSSGNDSEAEAALACYEWVDVSSHPTATLCEFRAALLDVLPRLGVPLVTVEGNAEPVQLPQATLLDASHTLYESSRNEGSNSGTSSSAADGATASASASSGRATVSAQRQRWPQQRRGGGGGQASCQLVLRYALDTTPTPGLPHHDHVSHATDATTAAASFQDLTNRFTLYLLPGRVVTVHRSECVFVEELKLRWRGVCAREHVSDGRYVVQYFVRAVLATFSRALTRCIAEFDAYEAGLFAARLNRAALAREIYHIKRRATVYARTLTMMQDAFAHTATALHMHPASVRYQEIQHDLAHIHALADGLNANADSVLQILFQLSSYQVNELMRVLTLFSAFFIPLSFIAAVYGMNFEQLPFLNTPHGELYCGVLMCAVALVIYAWFKGNHFI